MAKLALPRNEAIASNTNRKRIRIFRELEQYL
jgi:hypothetical protein